ncbi:MAG: hypothetical protein GYB35_17355, partial [Algicola sp.]|nr:hypothetical protein [Algicola sp.]
MKRYVEQLLEDLHHAKDRKPEEPDYRLLKTGYEDLADDLKYIAAWENAPDQSMVELFGISPEAFPPSEKLTPGQQQQLVEGIFSLWRCWNISPTIPQEAP